jgi:GTP:adenosylcobinamide-phosphate guanylyltransferase
MTGGPVRHALVLGGSRGPSDPVAAAAGVSVKAFAEVGGRPMIERVVSAIRESGTVQSVTVCLDPAAPVDLESRALASDLADGEIARMAPAGSPSASVLAALDQLSPDTELLVTTADHALLTSAMVRAFAHDSGRRAADAAIGLTRFDRVQGAHPGAVRTRLTFRDASYSSCNLFAFRGRRARTAIAFWQGLEADRKAPLRLARRIGLRTLAGYLSRRWTVDSALAHLGHRVGATIGPVVIEDPEAAIDVDTVEDLALVRAIVARRAAR